MRPALSTSSCSSSSMVASARRHRHRIPAEGRGMRPRLPGHQLGPRHRRSQRHPAGDPLGQRDHVRLQVQNARSRTFCRSVPCRSVPRRRPEESRVCRPDAAARRKTCGEAPRNRLPPAPVRRKSRRLPPAAAWCGRARSRSPGRTRPHRNPASSHTHSGNNRHTARDAPPASPERTPSCWTLLLAVSASDPMVRP